MSDPENVNLRWYNRRWFVVLAAIGVPLIIFMVINSQKKMDSQNSLKQPRQTLMSEQVPSLNLGWNIADNPANVRLHSGPSSGNYTSYQDLGPVNATSVPYPTVQTFYAVSSQASPWPVSSPSNEIAVGPLPNPSPTPSATATATIAPTPSPTATASATPSANFSVSVLPLTRTAGNTTTYVSLTYSVTVAKTGGFTGQVFLSAQGLPAGVEAKFEQNPSNTKRNLTLFVPGFLSPGTYHFVISGQGTGNLTRTCTANFVK